MNRALEWLYPPQDKIALFMMACLLLALVGFNEPARAVVFEVFLEGFSSDPLTMAAIAGLVFGAFFAALTFPFLAHDFRGMAVLVLALNALALFIAHGMAAFTATGGLDRWLNVAFALYFIGWLCVIKYGSDERLIQARDPQPVEALFAGVLCALLLLAALALLDMEWLMAYSLVIALGPQIHLALRRYATDTGLSRGHR